MLGRGYRGRRRLRDREGEPRVPAGRSVLGGEFAISFQPEKRVVIADLEDVSQLRTYAEDARAESAKCRGLAEVVGELLVGVTDEADKELLRQETRDAPIEVEINAALILGVRILEIVGEATDAGKLGTRCRVQIGMPAPRSMAQQLSVFFEVE